MPTTDTSPVLPTTDTSLEMPTTGTSLPFFFISHKHTDKKIADVISRFVTTYSGGRVQVYQSSSPLGQAPKQGRNLNRELKEALWRVDTLILVYTMPDQDWSYCMWECGLADHPQSPETKILLFQCMGTPPPLFAGQVNVNLRNPSDVRRFVNDFLTDAEFFPRSKGPITRFVANGPEVDHAADDLYKALEAELPADRFSTYDWPAWPFLQVELTLDHVSRISSAIAAKRNREASDIVLQEATVNDADKFCAQLFGFPQFPSDTSLKQLLERWRRKYPDSQSKWIDALCSQIVDGADDSFPPIVWELMQGVSGGTWHAPVLGRVRRLPLERRMQFDIYFCKFDLNSDGTLKVGVPQT